MRKLDLLFLAVIAIPQAHAGGQLFEHKDRYIEQEFENVYHDIRNSGGSSTSSTSSSSDPLTVSTLTVTSSGTIASLTVTNGIQGTSTNDSASAGKIGEVISATTTGDSNAAATTAYDDLLSIPLTAGDWDVSAGIYYSRETATWTNVDLGLSSTSGNSSTGLNSGVNLIRLQFVSSSTTPEVVALVLPSFRVSIAASTTYYLKRRVNYSAGTPISRGGRIYARRAR